MHPITIMLISLLGGSAILMLGIVVTREPERTFESTLREGLAWGSWLFCFMGAQILAISLL